MSKHSTIKQDITMYSDQELSLHFLNDEGLYTQARMCFSFNGLLDIADEFYIYTPEQLAELEQDFNEGSFD